MGYDIYWIKHPSFGSGKIHRRVKAILVSKTFSKLSSGQNEKIEIGRERKKSKLSESKIIFPNPSIKIIFQFWNTQGFPFVKHQPRKSQTLTRIIHNLKSQCEKFEQRQIANAIENGYALFNHPGFYFKHMYSSRKIGLHHFLAFTKTEKSMFDEWSNVKQVSKRFGVALPDSWFKECLKGWDYLKKNYCNQKEYKDEYPDITKQAISMMQMHLGRQINNQGKEKLVLFSKMLVNFAKLNGLDHISLLERINDALNSFHTIKISKIYYLTTEVFWADTLPSELIRFNQNKYETMQFISDKESLTK